MMSNSVERCHDYVLVLMIECVHDPVLAQIDSNVARACLRGSEASTCQHMLASEPIPWTWPRLVRQTYEERSVATSAKRQMI